MKMMATLMMAVLLAVADSTATPPSCDGTCFGNILENAELILEDCGDDGAKAPVGLRQIVNYVVFRPYYVESPEETDEIGRLLFNRL